MSAVEWVVISVGYVGLWVVAAVVLYPWARDDRMESPELAAAFFGAFWPVILGGLVIAAPFVGVGRFARWVADR